MKAVTYQGIKNVVVKEIPDPKLEKPHCRRGWPWCNQAEKGRSRHHSIYDRLRRMLFAKTI